MGRGGGGTFIQSGGGVECVRYIVPPTHIQYISSSGGGANTKSLKKGTAAVLFRPPLLKKKSFSKIDNFAYDHI